MSDNMLAPQGAGAAPAAQPGAAQPAPDPAAQQPLVINQALASRAMRGKSQEHMIRRRDAAGKEMEMLAKLASDPNPEPSEVTDYIKKLAKLEHLTSQQADQLIASIPADPGGIRQWAHVMFQAVMHEGVHAEAAFPVLQFPSPQEEDQQ